MDHIKVWTHVTFWWTYDLSWSSTSPTVPSGDKQQLTGEKMYGLKDNNKYDQSYSTGDTWTISGPGVI